MSQKTFIESRAISSSSQHSPIALIVSHQTKAKRKCRFVASRPEHTPLRHSGMAR